MESRPRDVLIRINAPHFVAGAVLVDDACVTAAPIVRYMAVNKWGYWRIVGYCEEKGWELEVL